MEVRLDGFLLCIVDFIMILPVTMLIIVFVTVIKDYTIYHFILIMSAFDWTAKARLFRTRTLSEQVWIMYVFKNIGNKPTS